MRFKNKNKTFWNKEYAKGEHIALSENPSEDLEKFSRWLEREYGKEYLNQSCSILDLGTGNGRNLIFLAKNFGIRGIGYDTSGQAIGQARKNSANLPLAYEVRTIAGQINLPDDSQTIVLDMMTSHFLRATERDFLRAEIKRVLKPGGWLFLKTFLLDEDTNAKRMIRDFPTDEQGSYIHPVFGAFEHVSTEEEIIHDLSDKFEIKKIIKSYGHLRRGKAKRRSICVYAQKLI